MAEAGPLGQPAVLNDWDGHRCDGDHVWDGWVCPLRRACDHDWDGWACHFYREHHVCDGDHDWDDWFCHRDH
jgi:hypothetical protein